MYRTIIAIGLPTLYLLGGAQAAAEIHGVSILLPDSEQWSLAYERSDADQYVREWVPSGRSLEDTSWMIVEQRLVLEKKTSAKELIRTMFNLAAAVCGDTKFNGPEKLMLERQESYLGRIMCSHQTERNYGTFTDQRVLVDGKTAYVVTSELRIPPTEVAGVLPFKTAEEAAAFVQLTQESAQFVRESIRLCHAPGC